MRSSRSAVRLLRHFPSEMKAWVTAMVGNVTPIALARPAWFLQDAIYIIRRAAKVIRDIGAVEDHPASIGIDSVRVDGRQSLRRDQKDKELVLIEVDGIPKDNERGSAALPQLVERRARFVTPLARISQEATERFYNP
jgi:hypothetical protein